jgi:dual specificity tyrosine-phosphorylation-regulated kinase 2/3/4
MNDHEESTHKEIYYKGPEDESQQPVDDINGDIIVKLGHQLMYRYEILTNIGRGAYGKVIKVIDHKYDKEMAIKIIKSKSRFIETGKHECNILIHLNECYELDKLNFDSDFIPLLLYKYFKFNNHICMVFELYESDLYKYSCENQIQYKDIINISRDLFKGLRFLKGHKLIHGDLKPENIMLNKDMRAIIIDYGLSFFEPNNNKEMYIQSRYYRAPEVYFNIPIKCAIDIWSLGCIMYEMYYNKPLFRGKNESQMIVAYISCLGMPFSDYINFVHKQTRGRIDLYDYQHLSIPTNKHIYNNKLIDNDENKNIHSLIRRCITYNWPSRIHPDTALKHDFFK